MGDTSSNGSWVVATQTFLIFIPDLEGNSLPFDDLRLAHIFQVGHLLKHGCLGY